MDFDRNRLAPGELMAGIAGVVLLIDLWFKWYGVKVSGSSGLLKGFSIGVSANAWEVFSLIDIILFLVALIAIGVAVARAMNRLPNLPAPPATIVAVAGAVALVLIVFRFIVVPVDTGDVEGIDVTRKIGLYLGFIAAAVITYGGWRAMEETGASWGDITGGAGGGGVGGGGTEPTTPMPAGGDPGVPGGGSAGVSPGKEGPGAPHPGTSTGAPGEAGTEPAPPAAGADPVPGENAGETPPGLAGEPPEGEGTRPAGL